MPRYLVEQIYPEGQPISADPDGAQRCLDVVGNNALDSVTWLLSYVTPDRRKAYCICDAPSPEAIRRAAQRSGLPVDRITEVRVLDPYFLL